MPIRLNRTWWITVLLTPREILDHTESVWGDRERIKRLKNIELEGESPTGCVPTARSAVLAVHLAKYVGLFVRVLTGVIDQTANSLADVGQLVALCHRLQKLDFFWFQRDSLFGLVFHEFVLVVSY